MKIRNAAVEDAASIRILIEQLGYVITEKEVENNILAYNKQGGYISVAESDDHIVGFISGAYIPLFHASGKLFRITALCVDANNRAKGIGKLLVQSIENICIENDCFYFEVTSGAHRINNAHIFYAKLGYSIYEGKRFLKTIPK